jgi:ADP-ribose pyrophosphatase YjhB (NUDIX family)
LEFGEGCEKCLEREFLEETGLKVVVGELLFTTELLQPPLHALELFFKVAIVGGKLGVGTDPESGENQLLEEVRFITEPELREIPPSQLHGIFQRSPKIDQIPSLKGYFKL